MKKRFLIIFSMFFVFGLFATAFALTGTNANADRSASCPMQQAQRAQTGGDIDLSNVLVVKGDGDDCCKPGADCCKGGSCCKIKKKK